MSSDPTGSTPSSEPAVSVQEFRTALRRWLQDTLEPDDPVARGVRRFRALTPADLTAERGLQARLHAAGYAGLTVPTEYGGRGLTAAHQRVFDEETSSYRLPDFGVASMTTALCLRTMLAHSAPDMLRRHVPRILRGEELWAQFFSETEAGSDLAGVRTRATRRDDGWVLDGGKVWSSGAQYCDFGMCLTRTNWKVAKHRGLTWFAVPLDAPGVRIEPIHQIGGEAEFCQEFFDGVVIDDGERIGEVDDGWTVARTVLVLERGFAEEGATVPSLAGEHTDLVALVRASGRAQDPVVRQELATVLTHDYAVAHLEQWIAEYMAGSGGLDAGVAAYAALAAGTFTPERAKAVMRIVGRDAVLWPAGDTERGAPALEYLNSRRKAIAGGTNEVQRNGIGEQVLGLPREPSFDSRMPFDEVLRAARNWSGRVG
ncbi:acyl-CoA dehydrogenase family protein [Pseudonocardia ailaonensis]|uniref:Acyl-CoA dehydrogenase family protein n=1 Tax=Pseudonocardia ailaonensis TaxID=367279 RepID=A0ABN2MIA3_9PSEU